MARSNKARYGTKMKVWKDTVYASRAQAVARATRKKLAQRKLRRKTKKVEEE